MSDNAVFTQKCPNCGGPLLFDPKSQKFHCNYCGSSFSKDEVSAAEEKQVDASFSSALTENAVSADNNETTQESSEVGLFLCPSCGAEIVTDATTASTFCFYCHNPVLLTERLSGTFLPEKVIPFQIERETAEQHFLNWVGKKKFIPKAFFNKKQIENLSGVYFPYWQVEASVAGNLSARGRTVRVWVQGDTEFTETSDYAIERKGNSEFKDLVKKALQKNLSDHLVGAVEPFDFSQAVTFQNQYLAGFLTEKRDIEFNTLEDQVENEFQNYATQLMKNTITGYVSVTQEQANQTLQKMEKAYVLLPIWLLTYREPGRDKLYYYAMNGQTGKVAGVLPIDQAKLIITTAFFAVILLIIGLAVGYLLS
ncbi:TFIIB-type zinc ribbon-containing protein [Lactococcus hircilactis]|uniref:TFIIB-type zinc ribbon-containing protein n=3 Tax=Lactococcus hircilactis TaxID=1494462 RepID=A0A7X1Z731_9LACT|nr:TFIIB-type zinc ribbon-containing protein [Lactococcus hircilactis]MQW38817.1 TFIIB-type zinc ribbon-containing protein [Lactococcus hircilactis]